MKMLEMQWKESCMELLQSTAFGALKRSALQETGSGAGE